MNEILEGNNSVSSKHALEMIFFPFVKSDSLPLDFFFFVLSLKHVNIDSPCFPDFCCRERRYSMTFLSRKVTI